MLISRSTSLASPRLSLKLFCLGLAAALLLGGCVSGLSAGLDGGGAGGSDEGGGGGQLGGGGGALPVDHIPPVQACVQAGTPAPRALRRLTNLEYNRTLSDLFGGDAGAPQSAAIFAGDPVIYGFANMASALVVNASDAATLQSLAEAAGALAAAKPTLVTACTSADDACRKTTVEAFGARAFRRPLTAQESIAYQKLMAMGQDFSGQLTTLVAAMLQSPKFLYRSELGAAGSGGRYTLTAFEVASELSYLIVGSMPDAQLTQAAADGSILDPSVRAKQISRLLADARAHQTVDTFFLSWLDVTGLGNASRMEGNDMLDPQTRTDMVEETRRLVDSLAFDPKATFASLFTVDHTFVNDNLVKFYGLQGGGGDFTQAPVGNRGTGVLGLGAVLAAHSSSNYASPTLCGRMVRMRMLCDALGSPPPGVPSLPAPGATQTQRQRFEAHDTSATCKSCHQLMDPLGFTMGDFDTLGRRRAGDMEGGQLVDASGAVVGPDGATLAQLPGGLVDLDAYLAKSPEAEACMVRHMVMYGLGQLDWSQDACAFQDASAAATAAGSGLTGAFVALAATPSFTQRVVDP